MRTFHGYVSAPAHMFKTGPDGKTQVQPINDHYRTVRPRKAPDADILEFDVNDGEFFQVVENIDKSEGRLGQSVPPDDLARSSPEVESYPIHASNPATERLGSREVRMTRAAPASGITARENFMTSPIL